jgi:hypothetical protein
MCKCCEGETGRGGRSGAGRLHEGHGRADLGGVGREARQEGDGVVMGWGAREGAIIWWGWRADAKKCVSRELSWGEQKMRQVRTWDGTETIHRSEAVARCTPK